MPDPLLDLWLGALPENADPVQAQALYAWLVECYAEPWRAYHTLAHVERMFRAWRTLAADAPVGDPQALALAIWFHDGIYEPGRTDNEARSAEEAASRLAPFGVDEQTCERVRRMVLATAAHDGAGADPGTALLLDLDLEILGASRADYDAYARAIRREYTTVPDDAYRVGRVAVLQGFLARPRIYLTKPMFARLEIRARRNLSREIDSLQARGSAAEGERP